jgi:hypothetical protein
MLVNATLHLKFSHANRVDWWECGRNSCHWATSKTKKVVPKLAKLNAKIEARTYTAIMLTFGCFFEMINATVGNFESTTTLSQVGWFLIIVSVPLFVLETIHKGKRR